MIISSPLGHEQRSDEAYMRAKDICTESVPVYMLIDKECKYVWCECFCDIHKYIHEYISLENRLTEE